MGLDQDSVADALPLYEVHGELGRGAWGVVLAARHRQLGRDVAIKLLPRAFGADPAVRSRFVSEARVLASLDHTHIVPIYDFLEHDGLCLLVMERLTGGTVWSRFQAGAFTPERSCAVALATCAALHYAHLHGVLHRDIKPHNLLFSAGGVVKVTDFGIAKVVGGSMTMATRAGDVLGTPDYMAPEQAQGGTLGPPTDIYALATVLYELFAGRLPFPEDSNPVATLYRRVHEKPRPLAEVAPHIPARLIEVTSRALHIDPAERYPDAETFGVALAEAAGDAWGPGWLGETGITVAAPSMVLGAALGARPSRNMETIGAQAVVPADAAPPISADTIPPAPADAVTPADLVPVNILQSELGTPTPLVEPPSAGSPPAPAPSALGTPRPPGSPTPGAAKSTPPRWVLAAVAVGVIVAVIAAIMVLKKDSPQRVASTPPPPPDAATSSTAVPLAPGSWRSLRDAPSARQQLASAVSQGTIWILGGLSGDSSTAKVEGYDPAIDTWKAGPDLPLPLHHQMAVTYRDELVVMGGWVPEGRNLTATVSDKVFALRGGSWTELPPLLHARAAAAAAVVGDKLVVFGGQAGGQLVPNVEVFDGQRWAEAPPLPTPRDHLAAASDGRYVYAVGGRELSADKNLGAFERYDPATGRWDQMANLPTPRGGLGAAITEGRLLTVGGESPTGVIDAVEMFDLAAGSWSAGPPMRTPRHGLAVVSLGPSVYALDGARQPTHAASSATAEVLDFTAETTSTPGPTQPAEASSWRPLRDAPTARQQLASAVSQGTIWILGGLSGDSSTAKVEGYDPAIDTWKSGPDLPLPLHHQMAVTYRDELVVMGGWVPEGRNLTATVSDKVFALRNGSWTELPPLLHARAAGAAAVVGDKLVVFGGQSGGQLIPNVEVFDGQRWVETAPLPTPRDHLAAASDDRYVYAVGGRELSADKNLGAFERYDPATGRWRKLPSLPTPRGGLGAAIVDGRLLAVGGESPTGVIDAVETFDLAAGSWSAGPPMRTPRHGLAVVTLGPSVYAFDGARQPTHAASSATAEVLDP